MVWYYPVRCVQFSWACFSEAFVWEFSTVGLRLVGSHRTNGGIYAA